MELYFDLENILCSRKLSKNKLCSDCSLQRRQVNRICQNKASRLDLSTFTRLCSYLCCTPNDLLVFREA